MNIMYNNFNGIQLPDLKAMSLNGFPMNQFGKEKISYLQTNPGIRWIYSSLLIEQKLEQYLMEVQENAVQAWKQKVKDRQAALSAKILSEADYLKWEKQSDTIREEAEQEVMRELIRTTDDPITQRYLEMMN